MNESQSPLSPAQRSQIRRLSVSREVDPADESSELNIVPFLDIIMNVLMFCLATIPAVFTVTIASAAPTIPSQPIDPPATKTLNLTLTIVAQGVSMKTSFGNIGEGCDSVQSGLTVPKKNGEYDWDSVALCARKLKDASGDYRDEMSVQVMAEPGVPYKYVIAATDAVRKTADGQELFPDVTFGVVR